VRNRSLPDQKTPPSGANRHTPRFSMMAPVPENLKIFAKGKTLISFGPMAAKPISAMKKIFAGFLEKAGFVKADRPRSESRLDQHLRRPRERRRQNLWRNRHFAKPTKKPIPISLLVLAGCVMGEKAWPRSSEKTYPYISLIIGTHDVANILTFSMKSSGDGRRSSMSAVSPAKWWRIAPFGPAFAF
jgi:hypothetical protein